MGTLDGARAELEQHVRGLSQHAAAEGIRAVERYVRDEDGGGRDRLRGVPRADEGSCRVAADESDPSRHARDRANDATGDGGRGGGDKGSDNGGGEETAAPEAAG